MLWYPLSQDIDSSKNLNGCKLMTIIILSKMLSADDHNYQSFKSCKRTTIIIFNKVLSVDDDNYKICQRL